MAAKHSIDDVLQKKITPTIEHLDQMYLEVLKYISDLKVSKINEISGKKVYKALLYFVSYDDPTISSTACQFIYKILKEIQKLSPHCETYCESLTSLSSKVEVVHNVNELCYIVLKLVYEDYEDQITKTGNYVIRYDNKQYFSFDLIEILIEKNPNCIQQVLTFLKSLRQKQMFSIFMPTLLKCLYESEALTLWELFQGLNHKIILYLLLWVQDKPKNYKIPLNLYLERNDNCSALLLAKSICDYVSEGLNPALIIEKFKKIILKSNLEIQYITSAMFVINLKKCSLVFLNEYTSLFLDLVLKNIVPLQIAQLMYVTIWSCESKTKFFSCFTHKGVGFKEILESKFIYLKPMKKPLISNTKIRLICMRYKKINEACQVLRFLYTDFPELEGNPFINYLLTYSEHRHNIFETKAKGLDFNLCLSRIQKETDPRFRLKLMQYISCNYQGKQQGELVSNFLNQLSMNEHNKKLGLSYDLYQKQLCFDSFAFKGMEEFKKGTNLACSIAKVNAIKSIVKTRGNYIEDYLPIVNNLINTWRSKKEGDFIIASALDSISVLCSSNLLDVSSLFNSILTIIDANDSLIIKKSLCSFLATVPAQLEGMIDTKNILYTSSRILWHFIEAGDADAYKALENFNIDIFDTTFLPAKCGAHNTEDRTIIPEPCWIHLLNISPCQKMANLFKHFITSYYTTKYKLGKNYDSLHKSLLKFVTGFNFNENSEIIGICLDILSSDWAIDETSGFSFDILCNKFLKCDSYWRKPLLTTILKHTKVNSSARKNFHKIYSSYLNEDETSYLCTHLKDVSFSSINDAITYVDRGMNSSNFENNLEMIKSAVLNTVSNTMVKKPVKRNVIKNILHYWTLMEYDDKNFQVVTQLISTLGSRLIRKLPLPGSNRSDVLKFIELYKLCCLRTQNLDDFDNCILIGTLYKSTQNLIMTNLIEILNNIKKSSKNILWLKKFYSHYFDNVDNFVILIFSLCIEKCMKEIPSKITIQSSIDYLPLGIFQFFNNSNTAVMKNLIKIATVGSNIHPLFREALLAGGLMMKDLPTTKIDSHNLIDISFFV